LLHLTSLAHLGFKKMMPNDRGIEMHRFDGHRCRHSLARGNRRTTSGYSLPALLRSFGRHLRPAVFGWPATPSPQGEGWRSRRDSNPR
jgi:hypothetical protein